jgi:hypothetical protein
LLASSVLAPGPARALGDSGGFQARELVIGEKSLDAERHAALGRWGWELVRRTSAPARLTVKSVRADRSELYAEPFAVWAGAADPGRLRGSEIEGLRKFLHLGGILVVDDSDPVRGAFGKGARRELGRVVPESPVVELERKHVVFKSFYIIDRPSGRVLGPGRLSAIVRGQNAQVFLLAQDLLGALARRASTSWAFDVEPGGFAQREQAVRFAVNLAMYVLCSDYKDDAVHAPWLMRRRAQSRL